MMWAMDMGIGDTNTQFKRPPNEFESVISSGQSRKMP